MRMALLLRPLTIESRAISFRLVTCAVLLCPTNENLRSNLPLALAHALVSRLFVLTSVWTATTREQRSLARTARFFARVQNLFEIRGKILVKKGLLEQRTALDHC